MRNFVNLGEYTRIRTGKLDANASSPNGKYPFFTCSQEPLRIESYSYDCECVLVAGNGDLNVKYYNGKFDAYQRTYIIESLDKDKLLPRYMFYFLELYIETLRKESIGGVIKYIKLGNLTNAKIFLPDLATQQKIIDILDKSVAAIARRKKQLASCDMLVKSQFIEMFEKGQQYEETFFGDVCLYVRNGANIKQSKGAGGYPITRIETLSNDVFNSDRLGYADITDLSRYTNYLLKKGDILISHINSIAYLGRAVQYRGEVASPVIHGMNLLCARMKEGYNPTYIEWYLKSKRAKDYIATITKKAVNQASITTSDLKKMAIPVPTKEKQDQFACFVEQTDKSKFRIKQSLEKLETLYKALLQKYFG